MSRKTIKKVSKSKKLNIGGQAVIEGVMIKSPNYYSVAVQKSNKDISVKSEKLNSFFNKYEFFKLPFIRGIFQLIEMLVLGIKTLSYSANESIDESEEKLSFKELFTTILLAFVFAALLFILLPLFLTSIFTDNHGLFFNFLDGVIRLFIFLIYLLIISNLDDVKRLFQYHGAEHKTIYCYEHNKKLTLNNVKRFSTLHPRCGTSFVLIVLILSILIFSLILSKIFYVKLILRLILLPLIAGISYELLKLFAKYEHKSYVKPFLYPGMLLQKLTTREPDDDQIKVAIKAVQKVIDLER